MGKAGWGMAPVAMRTFGVSFEVQRQLNVGDMLGNDFHCPVVTVTGEDCGGCRRLPSCLLIDISIELFRSLCNGAGRY